MTRFVASKGRFWNCISASFSLYLFLSSLSYLCPFTLASLSYLISFLGHPFIYSFPLSSVCHSSFLSFVLPLFIPFSFPLSVLPHFRLPLTIPLPFPLSVVPHFIPSSSTYLFFSPFPLSIPPYLFTSSFICLLVSPTLFFVMPCLISLFLLSCSATTVSLTNCAGIDTTFFSSCYRAL